MFKYCFSLLCLITAVLVIPKVACNPQYQKQFAKRLENAEQDSVDDLEDGATMDDLKGSASYGYGYYGYPFGGYYGGYPYSYGLHGGYYGGYYPYYGGYGFHGHYF